MTTAAAATTIGAAMTTAAGTTTSPAPPRRRAERARPKLGQLGDAPRAAAAQLVHPTQPVVHGVRVDDQALGGAPHIEGNRRGAERCPQRSRLPPILGEQSSGALRDQPARGLVGSVGEVLGQGDLHECDLLTRAGPDARRTSVTIGASSSGPKTGMKGQQELRAARHARVT
jgi:hypothetical protein